jgi:hypothetical protein
LGFLGGEVVAADWGDELGAHGVSFLWFWFMGRF